MGGRRLALRRSGAQLGLLATIALLTAVIAGSVGATVGYVQAAAVSSVRDAFRAADPVESALQVQTRLADDAEAQRDRVESTIRSGFGGVPLDVTRAVRTEALAATVPGSADEVRLVLEADPGAEERAVLVAGEWPSTPAGGALSVVAAAALGVDVGDVVEVGVSDDGGGTPIEIVGTWEPADAAAPVWFAERLALSGVDGTATGPLVVLDETIASFGTTPFVRWTIVPRADELLPAHLPTVVSGAADLHGVLRTDDTVAVRGLTVQGELGTTAQRTESGLQAVGAVTLVPVVLLALVSLVALVQVARLLGQTRAGEVGLLVARGASPRQVVVMSGGEALVVVAAGAVVGTGAAYGALRVLRPESEGLAVLGASGAVTAVVALAALVAVAGLQVRAVARRTLVDRSGRTRRVAAAGTVVLTFGAAALSLWQFRRYGSPLVEADGQVQVDPLAILAPAACLAALAVLVMAALGPLTQGGERVVRRDRRLVLPLAARQVARRLTVFVVPVVLVALAAGSATLAGAYAGTSTQLQTSVGELRNGADVRVTRPASGAISALGEAPTADALAAVEGVAAVANALKLGGTVRDESLTVTALSADRLPAVMSAPPGSLDEETVSGALVPDRSALEIPLPTGASALTLDVTAAVSAEWGSLSSAWVRADSEQLRSVRTTVWLMAPDGTLDLVDAGALSLDYAGHGTRQVTAERSTHRLTAQVPPGEWSLVGVGTTVEVPRFPVPIDYHYEVTSVAATSGDGEQPVDLASVGPWTPAPEVSNLATAASGLEPFGTLGVTGSFESGSMLLSARFLPVGDGASTPLPVAIPATVATHLDLTTGDELTLTASGVDVPLRVVTLVDVLPGAIEPLAALADLPTLADHLLRTRQNVPSAEQTWVAVHPDADQAAVAAAIERDLRENGDDRTLVTTAGTSSQADVSGPVQVAFWLATAGAVVLALAGVLAVAVALLRARRGEVMVLRALGVTPRAQVRGRRVELLGVTGLALVLGAGAGWVVALLTVSPLATSTLRDVDASLPAPVLLDVVPWLLCLAALLGGLLAVAAVAGTRVRAQALDSEYREEIR